MSKVRGLRRRWIASSVGTVFVIVLVAVLAFSVAMAGYYYSSMRVGLKAKAEGMLSYVSYYRTEIITETSYYQRMSALFASSGLRDSKDVEMQFIDATGSVIFSSFGLMANSRPGTSDIAGALDEADPQVSFFIGNDPETGERIMAVSCPYIEEGKALTVVRCVTSLDRVDKQLMVIVAIAAAIGIALLLLIYFSNLYFVNTIIIDPVTGITEITKRIAAGSYGVHIEKKYDDEIGDLTDAINDMSQKIDRSEKTQSEFIASVSHELRTPLTAINGWAETIMNGEVRDADDVRKGMGIIVSEARRLTNMVEELLEFSRIEDGRFTLSITPMDIKAELEDAVYTYREFFRREGIELNHTDCEEEFPPMEGDPERLRQVLCNLLDNAAKHGGAGGKIDTAICKEGDQAVITIRDYGAGIPEEELPHVKVKFYKGSAKARGSGIGLAVCDEIITRHGGTLEIGNAEGGGCVVTVRLKTEQ